MNEHCNMHTLYGNLKIKRLNPFNYLTDKIFFCNFLFNMFAIVSIIPFSVLNGYKSSKNLKNMLSLVDGSVVICS